MEGKPALTALAGIALVVLAAVLAVSASRVQAPEPPSPVIRPVHTPTFAFTPTPGWWISPTPTATFTPKPSEKAQREDDLQVHQGDGFLRRPHPVGKEIEHHRL